jgi:wobble nucleotide-excising tRNase
MINKIIKIHGIGIFHDAIPSAIKFSKVTTIYGENGRGKSTLSSIFSSLVNNDPSLIIARKTIGGSNNQESQILIENELFTFVNNTWDKVFDNIIIFDSEFVAKNIYSGFTILPEQRESLLEFTLGEDGGKLKKDIDNLTQTISKTTTEIREKGQIIAKIGYPLPIEAYVALQPDPEIDHKIEKVERLVESLNNIEEIVRKPNLADIAISSPDFNNLEKLLTTTITTISGEAKQKLFDHIAAHLKEKDEQWIKKGLNLVKSKNCPFCGKNLDGSEQLINLYREYFDESYHQYQISLQAFQRDIEDRISDAVLGRLQNIIDLNNSNLENNWKAITKNELKSEEILELKQILLEMRDISKRLITLKISNPLSLIKIDPEFYTYMDRIKTFPTQITKYNQSIHGINEEIQRYKQTLQTSNLASAKTDLVNWRMRKERDESPNKDTCQTYLDLIEKKTRLEREKDTANKNLAEYTNNLLDDIEEGINRYLSQFNAGFGIVNIDTSNEKGFPRLKYEIQLRNQNLKLNSSTGPAFSNTLSEGDKRTLAFAFFLTKTNLDPNISDKIIIIDDPMSSLDQSRQFTTQIALKSLASNGKQLIILSHDPRFLQSFFENGIFDQEDCVTLEIKRANNDYSIISQCDLEDCIQSAYKNNYRTVSDYIYQGQGCDKYFVVRAIRPFVEATLRNRFLDLLKGADGLGKMIDMIDRSPSTSPLARSKVHLPMIRELNAYTSSHIHDTSASDTVQNISDIELKKYAKFALDLAQGL